MTNRTEAVATAPAHVPIDGALIRRRRQSLGETIASLSAQVPMSDAYLCHIELGRRKSTSPRMATKLARALGMTIDEIRAAS